MFVFFNHTRSRLDDVMDQPEQIKGIDYDHYCLLHSTAHIMAAAIKRIDPDAKLTVGPPINRPYLGFYYDIDFTEVVSSDDLDKIKDEMQKMKARIKKLHCSPDPPAGSTSKDESESLKMKALISKVHSTPGDPASEPEAPILIGKGRGGAETFTWRAERANVHPRKLVIRQGTHRS